INSNLLKNRLVALHVQKYPPPKTGLIPTSLDTENERFVDTVKEAELIQLAVKLNECSLAVELLDFYWDKSQGGVEPLHASYDAETGASLARDIRYKRPTEAERTAESQLA